MGKWDFPPVTKKMADAVNKEVELEHQRLEEDFVDPDLENDETQLANHKREALADYLNCDVEDVEWDDDNRFSCGVEEYIVCTYDEAYDLAVKQVKEIINDLGLESFSEEYKDHILNDDRFFDYDTVRGWMQESYEGYVEDIEYERDSDFGNRLVQEMYDNGVLTDEDFEVDEDGETDYLNLKPSVNFEDKKQIFIEKICEDIDPVEWLQEIYGTGKELADFVSKNDIMDWDAVAEDCVDTDGIAHTLASYDGKEIKLDDDLFAYRTN